MGKKQEPPKKPNRNSRYFAKKKPLTRIGFYIICFKVDATVSGKKLMRWLLGKK